MSASLSPESLLAAALEVLESKDSGAFLNFLNSQPPLQAAEICQDAQMHCYWQRRDLPSVIAVSRSGIQHALTAAAQSPDSQTAASLRGAAKALAYNLASFTWPGWNEPGIPLTSADLAIGLDAARLNLRLAEELRRPPKAQANAFWVLGAHELAAGQLAPASHAFQTGKSHAAEGGETLLAQMLDGYLLLTGILARPTDPDAKRAFETHLAALHAEGSEDAREYATQLATALAVFSSASPFTS